jgi:hypothetical protein
MERRYLKFGAWVFVTCGLILAVIGVGTAFSQRNDRVTTGFVFDDNCRAGSHSGRCDLTVHYRASAAYESSALRNVPVANIHTMPNGGRTTGVRYSTDDPGAAKQPNDYLTTPRWIALTAVGAAITLIGLHLLRRQRIDRLVASQRERALIAMGFEHAQSEESPESPDQRGSREYDNSESKQRVETGALVLVAAVVGVIAVWSWGYGLYWSVTDPSGAPWETALSALACVSVVVGAEVGRRTAVRAGVDRRARHRRMAIGVIIPAAIWLTVGFVGAAVAG